MNVRGFTLLEMMVAVAVLTVVLVAVSTLMVSTSQELRANMPAIDLDIQVDRTTNRIRSEIEDASASLVTVAADGSWISFAVPVEIEQSWGASGDRQARWGSRLGGLESSGGLNALVFQESAVAGVSPVKEGDVISGGLNLNVNTETVADTGDEFTVGHISLVYDPDGSFPTLNGDEVTRKITGDWVVQVADDSGDLGGDVSGDGAADPVFTLNGTAVQIDLWGLRVLRQERTSIMSNSQSLLALKNP